VVAPGVLIWISPHGYRYLRDRTGTRSLDPLDALDPPDPPGPPEPGRP
jgi:hypothetical protein